MRVLADGAARAHAMAAPKYAEAAGRMGLVAP